MNILKNNNIDVLTASVQIPRSWKRTRKNSDGNSDYVIPIISTDSSDSYSSNSSENSSSDLSESPPSNTPPECINNKINDGYYKNTLIKNTKKYAEYNPILNCKSAGVIPYTIIDSDICFLFQTTDFPNKKKESGWNDFGGKRSDLTETTTMVAAREFCEETSCLFYIREKMSENNTEREYESIYDKFKSNYNIDNEQAEDSANLLPENILNGTIYYNNKINLDEKLLYTSSKETYISYFLKVPYIPTEDIPSSEDMHIKYNFRYTRKCKWFRSWEILKMTENDFHKRLRLTKIRDRIETYLNKKLFNFE